MKILSLSLCLTAVGAHGAADVDPKFNGPYVVRTKTYELRAPVAANLAGDVADLDYTVTRFMDLFGELPPAIAVVVIESPEQFASVDPRSFNKRGLQVLLWLPRDKWEASMSTVVAVPEIGVVFEQHAPTTPVVVSSVRPDALPPGVDIRPDDVVVSVGGEQINSTARLKELISRIDAGGDIRLLLRRDGEESPAVLAKPPSMDPATPPSKDVAQPPARTDQPEAPPLGVTPLPHEAGHYYFISYVDNMIRRLGIEEPPPAPPGAHYGHPGVPDWLDEGVAVACEQPEWQRMRLQYLRDHGDRIPLAELLTMEHPLNEPLREIVERASARSGHYAIAIDGFPADVLHRGMLFYSESWAFVDFIVEKAGPDVLHRLVRDSLRGDSTLHVLTKTPPFPTDAAELERQWVTWLEGRLPPAGPAAKE